MHGEDDTKFICDRMLVNPVVPCRRGTKRYICESTEDIYVGKYVILIIVAVEWEFADDGVCDGSDSL
jgi:hypothetical protein